MAVNWLNDEAVPAALAEMLRLLSAPAAELESEREGDESAEAFVARRSLEAALPAIRNQKRQRIQEALSRDAAMQELFESWKALTAAQQEFWRRRVRAAVEAAALDTLDPSGDKDLAQGAPRPETTGDVPDPHHGPSGHRASVAGETSKSDPSGEEKTTECESCGYARPDCKWAGGEEGGYVCGSCRASTRELGALLKAVEPFTVDGGVSCGSEEVDKLVETYEQIIGDCPVDPPMALAKVRAELQHRADQAAAIIGMASPESELRAQHEEQALRAAICFIDDADHFYPATDPSKEEREEKRDYFYLCLNCGGISHVDTAWTFWQYDDEGELRPSREGETDARCKCPQCGELHGDCYEGAGVEDGTKAEVEAEKAQLLAKDPEFFVGACSKEVGGDGE